MTHFKQFLQQQKIIIDLIPKSKQKLVYDGLQTKLDKAINEYIKNEIATKEDYIRKEYNSQIIKLKNQIQELAKLLDQNGIKYGISASDVYPKGSGRKGE